MNDIVQKKSLLGEITGLIKLIRLRQWVKNIFVFAPLVFSGEFLKLDAILLVCLAAFFFCLAASVVYIVNDIHDIEKDRLHPEKSKKRPLASGAVSLKSAYILLVCLYLILSGIWFFNANLFYVIVLYVLINLAYTFKLKDEPVIEIFIIAFGFVLRVYAGAVVLAVVVSNWMFITVLSLSLYLAAIKRRQELTQSGIGARGVLKKYTVSLIDRFAEMSAICAIIFYSLYVMAVQSGLVITIPLVLFGLFRYWYIVESLQGGESPTDVLIQDWQILATVLLWVIFCLWALWP